jgi:serine/threonine protein kinase
VDALDQIHKSGYAHMDIKLSNILMDENDVPHIADFGLAVRTHSDELLDGKLY